MATTRTKVTETTLLDAAETETKDERTPEQRAADDELQVALAEIGESEGRVQCIRTAPKDEAGIAGTYTAQEFSIERLRDEWGGGTYQLYFRLPNGTLKTKRTVQIIAKKSAPTPPDRTAEIIAALQSKGDSGNANVLTSIIQMMQAQADNSTKMIVAMIQAQGNQKGAGMGPAELVALLGAIEGLKGKGSSDKGGSSLDELVKVLKVAKELGGDGDDGGGTFGKIASIAGPLLEKLADRMPAPTPQAPAPRVPVPIEVTSVRTPPAPATTSESSTAPAPTTEDPNMQLRLVNWLRETLKFVMEKAAADKDPALYADYILDNLPEGITADVILPQLKAEDALDRLAFFDARVNQYRDWLDEFRLSMVETIEDAQKQAAPVGVPPEVPKPDADPVATLYESPNPSNDSEG